MKRRGRYACYPISSSQLCGASYKGSSELAPYAASHINIQLSHPKVLVDVTVIGYYGLS